MSTATLEKPTTKNAPKADKKPEAPKAPQRAIPKFGEFKAKITRIDVLSSVIFTRLTLEDRTEHTHAVRFNHPQAMQIGLDEFRGAFPEELGALDNTKLLAHFLSKTKEMIGREVVVSIDKQMKNGLPVTAPDGSPYYNVRFRSNLRDLKPETAEAVAARLVAQAAAAATTATASTVSDAEFADRNVE